MDDSIDPISNPHPPSVVPWVAPEPRMVSSENGTSDSSIRFTQHLSSILPFVNSNSDLGCYLEKAIRNGPHYSTMQHMKANHNVNVPYRMLLDTASLTMPSSQKIVLLEFLLNANDLDINRQVDGWFTVLRYFYEDKEVVEYLLRRGANPNMGPAAGARVSIWGADELVEDAGSALTMAIRRGTLDVVETLVQHGAILGYSIPVHCAVDRGDENMLRKVLELGANIDETDATRRRIFTQYYGSPLMRAVSQNKLHMVDVLLRKGANVWYRNRRGMNVMDLIDGRGVDAQIKAIINAAWLQKA
ncbi:unnamed protein product [Periconia digitata]|uniref:Uncharacterized protein n=1 Tax=Periconia digitata TaxID=1303443 RepID=A0A9W4XJW4_9PLEO|nr:unnamed protein product [Periconia digitata]